MWAVSFSLRTVSKRIVPKPDLVRSLASINRVVEVGPASTTDVSPEEQALSAIRDKIANDKWPARVQRLPDRTGRNERNEGMGSAPRYFGGYCDVESVVEAFRAAVTFARSLGNPIDQRLIAQTCRLGGLSE